MQTGTAQPSYLAVLEESIVSREATIGFRVLDESQSLIAGIDANQSDAIAVALCYAQWIDLGYTRIAPFDALCRRIDSFDVSTLPVLDFLRWQLVKAIRAANIEDLNEALHCLDIVETAGKGILPGVLVFLTAYWKGRWHRRRGEYNLACRSIKSAQEQARLMGAPRLVAVTKLHESWLVSQKGDRKLAFALLDEAEAELLPTGHALSLGNIESARGRFVRRSGEYTRALAHFEKAILLFSTIEPEHVNLARALVNAAYVKRLIALDRLARSRASSAKGAVHQRHLKTVAEALELLNRARAHSGDQVHRAAHPLHAFAGDEPVGEVALRRDLHRAQNREVDVSTADHRKGIVAGEGRRAWEEGHRLFAGVDDVCVHLGLQRIRTEAEQAVLRLQRDRDARRDVIGHLRRHANAEVHIEAVLHLQCRALRHLFADPRHGQPSLVVIFSMRRSGVGL